MQFDEILFVVHHWDKKTQNEQAEGDGIKLMTSRQTCPPPHFLTKTKYPAQLRL